MRTILSFVATALVIIQLESVSAGRKSGSRNFHAFDPQNCNLSPEIGECRATHTRWYYDPADGDCKVFTWGGCGGNANKFAAKWMCERKCKPASTDDTTCSTDTSCTLDCPRGFLTNRHGCQICRCRSDNRDRPQHTDRPNRNRNTDNCPEIECPGVSCQYGYARDSTNGCPTCECRTSRSPRSAETGAEGTGWTGRRHGGSSGRGHRGSRHRNCTEAMCRMHCPFGNKRDENGCHVCECKTKEEACGAATCFQECPHGFKTDRRGCDICECRTSDFQATDCRVQRCSKRCSFGLEKDSMGCDMCVCSTRRSRGRGGSSSEPSVGHHSRRAGGNQSEPHVGHHSGPSVGHHSGPSVGHHSEPSVGHHSEPSVGHHSGPAVGHHSDSCGVRPMCMMYCANGFKKDANGCDLCQCQEAGVPAQLPVRPVSGTPSQIPAHRPAQLPAAVNCREIRCKKNCAFGFDTDELGCARCQCALQPRPVRTP